MENVENINKLKELASEFRILFVEDSLALQKQVVIFLKKLFKEVYVASNGQEGLESFEKNKPDLVLTDLTMPKMSGHDMIRAIKKLEPDVEVVILSAHSDSETLMKSLHIGVSDFIAKPVNATKMIATFLKVLSNMKRKEFELVETFSHSVKEKEENEQYQEEEEVLEFIFENSMEIDIINHYKGVPIINSAKILSIDENTIKLKTTYLQILAMKHEQKAILDSSLIGQDILCSLEELDLDNYEVILKKEKLFHPDFKNRNELCLELPKGFKAFVFLNEEKKVEVEAINLSKKELLFHMQSYESYKKHDKLKIQIHLPKFNTLKDDESEKILNLEASIYKLEEGEGNKKSIDVLLNLDEKNEELLDKYINDREIFLFDEFKEKYNY